MNPNAILATDADLALARALANSDAGVIAGASRFSGPAVTIDNFTATTGGVIIAAFSLVLPEGEGFQVGTISGSVSLTVASAATFTVTAQQNNGGVASGGTASGSFRYLHTTPVVITGGSAQAGLGATSVYELATGNITAWTFPLNGLVVGTSGEVVVVPVIVEVNTGNVAITNCVFIGGVTFVN